MSSHHRIRVARRQARLSQAQLAAIVGVQRSAVSHWEAADGKNPSVGHMRDIALALGVHELVLLTTTAAPFFARRGYQIIDRLDAPAGVQRSEEFRGLCPASAICMQRVLHAHTEIVP